MARVFLLSATPPEELHVENQGALEALRQKAMLDKFRAHSLTTDAESADLILFVESYGAGWHFERVRSHPLTRKYREKCFIFCSNPYVIPFLPGIYAGVAKRWASRRTISGFYLGLTENQFTTYTPASADLPYLFSFVGSTTTSGVRREIAALTHPRGLVRDTSADYDRVLHRQMEASELRDYHRSYAEAIRASKFVLCPRGLSVSTVRLFETMRMGRVPVILSDGWVEPEGPRWDDFSIRVAEADWARIPRLLEEHETKAQSMGELAREQWLDWFSDEVAFHRVVEWCLAIQKRRTVPERLARWPAYLQYLERFHLRRAIGTKLRAFKKTIVRS